MSVLERRLREAEAAVSRLAAPTDTVELSVKGYWYRFCRRPETNLWKPDDEGDLILLGSSPGPWKAYAGFDPMRV